MAISKCWRQLMLPLFQQSRLYSVSSQVHNPLPNYRVVASVCVQRFPVISKDKTPLEQKFHDLQVKLRFQRSRLSDFELEEKQYLENKKAREKKAMEEEIDISKLDGGTEFEELQEARETELKLFEPQSRVTEADLNNDRKSLNRKLDSMLYLLVKNPQEGNTWSLPQGVITEGKTLSESAEIELANQCGPNLSVQLTSNTPSAYHQYKSTNGQFTKLFFIKAHYISGTVDLNTELLEDYVWLTKDELKHYLPLNYYNAIAPTLFT